MDALQVLVATMYQENFSLAEKMNINCSAVFANQADRSEMCTTKTPYGILKMITTPTRGVGLNRNIALLAADAEYLLLADDDMVYREGMQDAVVAAFRENPAADVLIFGVDILKNGEITEKRHLQKKRLRVWNSMRFGTYRIAVRRESIIRENIMFHQSFGGGCPFSSGEDSLFLKACFDKGLRVYAHDYVLGTCCKDSSSWFSGCNEKYFYDKGVLMRQLFPKIPYLMALYFAVQFKRETELSAWQRIRLMFTGVRGGKCMKPYQG